LAVFPLPIGISFFTFQAVSYLIDVGTRKVFVQGDGIQLASNAPVAAFDAVAEGVAYGRKRPRNPRRR